MIAELVALRKRMWKEYITMSGVDADDLVDRANNALLVVVCIFSAIFAAVYHLSKSPIDCWLPAPLKDNKKYINWYCYIYGTYELPFRQQIPVFVPDREERELNYYQWAPFLLLFMACCYRLPQMLWSSLNSSLGLELQVIFQKVSAAQTDPKERVKNCRAVAEHINFCFKLAKNTYMKNRRKIFRYFQHFGWVINDILGTSHGKYLFLYYMFIKVIYVAVGLFLMKLIEMFLVTPYNVPFGIGLLADLFSNRGWKETGVFPRVTMCDFEVRVLGNLHRHTVQCTLPINLFYEKIFLVVWWVMVITLIATIISGGKWIYEVCFPINRMKFMKRKLREYGIKNEVYSEKTFDKFVNRFLNVDGVFLLLLLNKNTNKLLSKELVGQLWEIFDKKENATRPGDRRISASSSKPSSRRTSSGTPSKQAEERLPLLNSEPAPATLPRRDYPSALAREDPNNPYTENPMDNATAPEDTM